MNTGKHIQAHTLLVWVFVLMLVCVSGIVWHAVFAFEGEKYLTVSFLDVGQGDAVFIETPSGTQVLIDGGKGRAVLRELGRRMSFFDKGIDMVLVTHPDADHIGGLPEVFARFDVDIFMESGVTDTGSDNEALQQAVLEEGLSPILARQEMKMVLDTDVVLHILFPDRDVTRLEPNTSSVVIKLVYGDTSFLLTGDSPKSIETYLISIYGKTLESDVLKLGHHGSKTSSADAFLGFVSPQFGIISASCDNAYGHPHTEVLESLQRHEIEAVSTCENGTIIFESDGKEVRLRS